MGKMFYVILVSSVARGGEEKKGKKRAFSALTRFVCSDRGF